MKYLLSIINVILKKLKIILAMPISFATRGLHALILGTDDALLARAAQPKVMVPKTDETRQFCWVDVCSVRNGDADDSHLLCGPWHTPADCPQRNL